jgi:hypothetical protein
VPNPSICARTANPISPSRMASCKATALQVIAGDDRSVVCANERYIVDH